MQNIKLETTYKIELNSQQVEDAIRDYIRKNFSDSQNYKITYVMCSSWGGEATATVKLEKK